MIDLIRHYTVHMVFIESYQPQKQWYVTLCLNRNTCLTYVCTLQAWNLLWIMVALSWHLIFFLIFPSPLLPFDLPSFTCLSLLPWLISLLIFLAWKCGPIFSGFTNSPVFVSFFLSSPSHQAQTTCWDHPKMTELYQALGEWEDN